MTTHILGLDIREEALCGVVVSRRGGERQVVSACRRELEGFDGLEEALVDLLGELNYPAGPCVVGLPLSLLSLRNLTLPFSDRRKILQVLPLELEEQMLVPADELVVDFRVTGREGQASRLLVAALEKEFLRFLLPILTGNGLTVHAIVPAACAPAREITGDKSLETILLMQVKQHGVTSVLLRAGQVLFMRFVAYPEIVFDEPFSRHEQELDGLDREAVEKSLVRVCEITRASLYYYGQNNADQGAPSRIMFCGCMGEEDWWTDIVGREFGLEVERVSMVERCPRLRFSGQLQGELKQGIYDTAVALAVSGLQKKKRTESLDFLQGEFASAGGLLLSRQTFVAAAAVVFLLCAAGLGYLWTDYRRLDERAHSLHNEMKSIFTQTFPTVTRIVDPLVQMQSKLREVQGSEVSLPLFFGEKRVLETLADISARIPDTVSLHVSRLVIDKEAVQIKGTTDAYNNVDVIKNKLAASPRYAEVKIVSATADKKTKKIRFEIRLLFEEAS